MSYLFPVELSPSKTPVPVPTGDTYIPIYDQPLPTNIQIGETWTFKQVVSQVRLLLMEKAHEIVKATNEKTVFYKTVAEREAAETGVPLFTRRISPATFDSKYENAGAEFKYRVTELGLLTEEALSTARSIIPCPASLMIELVGQQGTIYSTTVDGTFRLVSGTPETGFTGQCTFSDYSDLINHVAISTEHIRLRISISLGISVPAEIKLQNTTTDQTAGFVNLIYDKE
jgi:hypothetical protein